MSNFKSFKVKNTIPNKSRFYIFPLLNELVKFGYQGMIINTYLSYENGDKLFCVLYHWNSDRDFLKNEGKIMSHPLYVGHADYGKMVLFKFKLPVLIMNVVDMIMSGNHKNINDRYKQVILDNLSLMKMGAYGHVKKVLDKNDPTVDSIPQASKETASFNIEVSEIKLDKFAKEGLF